MERIEEEQKQNWAFVNKNNIKVGSIVRDNRLNEREVGGIHPNYGWITDKNGNQILTQSIYDVINRVEHNEMEESK